jgi:hypothetical protein
MICALHVFGGSFAGNAGSNPVGDVDMSFVNVFCRDVDVPESGLSPIQSHNECGMSK